MGKSSKAPLKKLPTAGKRIFCFRRLPCLVDMLAPITTPEGDRKAILGEETSSRLHFADSM